MNFCVIDSRTTIPSSLMPCLVFLLWYVDSVDEICSSLISQPNKFIYLSQQTDQKFSMILLGLACWYGIITLTLSLMRSRYEFFYCMSYILYNFSSCCFQAINFFFYYFSAWKVSLLCREVPFLLSSRLSEFSVLLEWQSLFASPPLPSPFIFSISTLVAILLAVNSSLYGWTIFR